jgi:hypothetical protein
MRVRLGVEVETDAADDCGASLILSTGSRDPFDRDQECAVSGVRMTPPTRE